MKSIRRIFALVLFAVLGIAAAQAQMENPVKWSANAVMTSANEGVLTLTATIQPGWHLYSTNIPEGGPIATEIKYSLTGIKLVGKSAAKPAATKQFEDMFGLELAWWTGKVQFTQKFKVTNKKNHSLKVSVRFMSCNDENCMPPAEEEITVNIPEFKKK